MCQKKGVVGIISRDHASCYEWLTDLLLDSSLVTDVRCIYVSDKFWSLKADLEYCTFAILYHTKRRGRVNVTDVTDSLYDEELALISDHLGKKNVIVVIDDLEDASEYVKVQILESQPKIGKLAHDLILFSDRKEKKYTMFMEHSRTTKGGDNLQQIRNAVKGHNKRLWAARCWRWTGLYIALLILLSGLFAVGIWLIEKGSRRTSKGGP